MLSAVVIVAPAEDVIAPSTCRVDAISTAPSISTTSKLVVPSTSMSPDMSSDPNEPTPVVVILLEPVSIVPKPLVILPLFNAPTVVAAVVTRLGIAVISSSK